MIAFFDAPPPAAAQVVFPDLTEREREILLLLAQGKNNRADRIPAYPKRPYRAQLRVEHLQ